MSSLIVIVNPVCGAGQGKDFIEEHVLPVLKRPGLAPSAPVFTTEYPGHAGELVLKHLQDHQLGSLTVIVASGDGTVHEIVNTLEQSNRSYEIDLVLIPVGTANALYASMFAFCPNPDITAPSYKLQSVHAYLADAIPRPLTVMSTNVGLPSASPRTSIQSIVVTSTSLHASILHDSERLRASHPGIERFKIAAQENITRWYSAKLKLLPLSNPGSSGGSILKYSPSQRTIVPVDGSVESLSLEGPFSYFASTANVDRLETEFVIMPLQSRIPATYPSIDIALIRPHKSPQAANGNLDGEAFAAIVGKVLGEAYNHGSHVDIVYDEEGQVHPAELGKDQMPVVEYYRCGGWEWTPASTDEPAHLLCADGTILKAQAGEVIRCMIPEPAHNRPRFTVYGR